MKKTKRLYSNNYLNILLRILPILLLIFAISACSEDSNGDSDNSGTTVSIGKSDSSGFEHNVIDIENPDLLAGQSTTIHVALINNDGSPYITPVTVSFTASCASSIFSVTSTQTVNGVATVQYTAGHCQGLDEIEASVAINGYQLIASGNVAVTRPVSIQFGTHLANLNPGQTIPLIVSLRYSNGELFTTPVDLSFTTNCNTSSFSDSSLGTVNGSAENSFTAGNCVGVNTVSATALVNGVTLIAITNITINQAVSISIHADQTDLISGESTTVTTALQYSDLSSYPVATQINLTTSCASSSIPTPAITNGGFAVSTYVAGNCQGTDTITATANINGDTIVAAVNINLSAPVLNLGLGRGSGATFELGILGTGTGNLADGQSALAAGGSTTVTATIVDLDNANSLYGFFTGNVNFTSPCVASGLAVMTSPISVVGGTATTTYVSNGCVGDDTITASSNLDGFVAVASTTITNAPQLVGGIVFVSANPEQIAIQGSGSGYPETTTLSFRVQDNSGIPVANQIVEFSVSTNIGGIMLSSASAVTNTQGIASVTLQSGTISTPVYVTASTTDIVSGIDYGTQSNAIVISSLYPDQDSLSLSFSECSPAAWEIDGVSVEVTARAADHFNNPVPDGTPVSFRTEGGSIDASCLTIGGICSVTWTSQNPRPADGRSTILATMVGNESYIDLNGNGIFDDGDIMGADLPEAWLDANENGIYDAGVEEFLDFDLDNLFTPANGLYDGVLCQHSSLCSTGNSIHVRQSGVINMASTSNLFQIDGGTSINAPFSLPAAADPPLAVNIIINSGNGNYPASGTVINVESTNGQFSGPTNFVVPDSCSAFIGDPYYVTVYMNSDGVSSVGILTVTATTSGIVSQQTVNVSD